LSKLIQYQGSRRVIEKTHCPLAFHKLGGRIFVNITYNGILIWRKLMNSFTIEPRVIIAIPRNLTMKI